MPGTTLPIFPLSLVLLPTTPLPLHIFEDRYKEMMGLVIPGRGEFGVVLAREGGVVNIGCSATVEEVVQRYPDGRLDLIARGRRRFQILSLDEEKSYLQAEVEYFNDNDDAPAPPALQQQAIAEYGRLQSLVQESPAGTPRIGEPQLSFQLAEAIDDLEYRQALLVMRSEKERLVYFIQSLPRYIKRREQKTLAKRVGPRNGHAKHYNEGTRGE